MKRLLSAGEEEEMQHAAFRAFSQLELLEVLKC